MSSGRRLGKQHVAYPYDGMLLGRRKGRSSDTCHKRTHLEDVALGEVSQSRKDKCCAVPCTRHRGQSNACGQGGAGPGRTMGS